MDIRSLAVFCGSSNGRQMLYRDAATEMGQLLAREQIKLVYGGGKNGMMGTVADAALAAGAMFMALCCRCLSSMRCAIVV